MTRRIRSSRSFVLATLLTVLGLVVSGTLLAVAASPPPAHLGGTVGLKRVGPVDEATGYPMWYQDTTGTRLELCMDPGNPSCIAAPLPDSTQPVSFPSNFPDESFYSNASAALDTGSGKAKLVTGVEAAFAGAGTVAVGQQITFGRVRVVASGLTAGKDYKVTQPYGSETFTADAGTRGIFDTQDVGALTADGGFDQTLAARSAPFLRWPAGSGAPAGYLGDPAVNHAVTGSPYDTNLFRIEGPAGSFTGSTQLCANPALGGSTTATDDCVETDQFSVSGKIATRSGVQVTRATYQDSGTGHMMDLFAYSTPGQKLVVSGTGVSQTTMRESATGYGRYYARVYADGAPPNDLKVTNVTDAPNTVDRVQQSEFGDRVHAQSAVYDNDSRTLSVTAQSGDASAKLTVEGFTGGTPTTTSSGATTWTFTALTVPPDEVTVTSDKGGVDMADVVITGADDPSSAVVATLVADATAVQTGQAVTLDGTSSSGTITGYSFSVSPSTGATLSGTGGSRTFTATSAGSYTVTMTVTGNGAGNTSTDKVTITVAEPAAPPVADAGPDQLNVVPTSTVTLDGSASKFASSYAWTQTAGPALTGTNALKNAATANPSFVAPATTAPASFTFRLTITDVNGTTASDLVTVTTDPDDLTVDSATYKRGGTEWRVRGSAQYCSANNVVSVYWNKPDGTTALVGTTAPALALGVCSYDFRLKNAPAGLRPTSAGTLTVRSTLGGEVLNRAFQLL